MPIPVAGEFAALLSAYLEELHRQHASLAVYALARTVLPRLFAFLACRGIESPKAVQEADLFAFARELGNARTRQGEPLSAWTKSTYLTAVRRFFRFLRSTHLLLDPARQLRIPEGQRLPRAFLSPAQAGRLMSAPQNHTVKGQRDRAILEVLYGTGLRVRECEGLDVTDLDLAASTLFVRNGKGRKDRVVPLTRRASEALDLYLREARPCLLRHPGEVALFLARGGRRLHLQSLEILVRGYAKRAGLAVRVTPHTLRHACATHLLRGGADVRHVQRLLGHAELGTTALYTRVEMGDLRQVLQKAHPRERKR